MREENEAACGCLVACHSGEQQQQRNCNELAQTAAVSRLYNTDNRLTLMPADDDACAVGEPVAPARNCLTSHTSFQAHSTLQATATDRRLTEVKHCTSASKCLDLPLLLASTGHISLSADGSGAARSFMSAFS